MSSDYVVFDKERHDKFDIPGREAVKKYLAKTGWECTENPYGKKGIDLKFSISGIDIFVDVEVQETHLNLTDLNDYKKPWVSIVKRKGKYGKDKPRWFGWDAYLFECNLDMTQAFVVQAKKLDEKYLIQKMAGRDKLEWFYHQPVEHFRIAKF